MSAGNTYWWAHIAEEEGNALGSWQGILLFFRTSQKGAAEAGGSPLVGSINQKELLVRICLEMNTLSPSWIRR